MTIHYPRGGVAQPGTTLGFKTGTWRVQRPLHLHASAPCHSGCPAGEDPQAYLAKVDEGHMHAAWEALVAANPLPAITGRVCPHPCESACNRSQFDAAVSIHSVERYLGDQAISQDWPYPVTRPHAGAPRVAVVGAGPSGLSAAYHLMRHGLNVTVFTALPEAGGTLHAIPGYRLPTEVLRAEVERLLATGMDFRPNRRLGRDVHVHELRNEFAAVYIAVGTQESKEWSIGGAVPQDLHEGLGILKEWMSIGTVPISNSAAVVGGGNTAIDTARVLLRAGVPEVHLITHNGLPGPETLPEDAMVANPGEIEQAIEEGVQVHAHRGIRRLILRGERVVGVEMLHMKKMRNTQGELERVAFEGTESVLHVEQVIPAIGQVINSAGLETLLSGRPFLEVDHWGQVKGRRGVFAGGDACASKRGTVASAIGDGRRAAEAIARYIQDKAQPEPSAAPGIDFAQLNINYYEHAPAAQPRLLPVVERKGEEEIELGLNSGEIAHEAQRCFSCGNCLACDNCWTLCPDSAVLKTKEVARDGSHYVFDYDFCKGCGLCANECPCGYIIMQEEP